GTRIEPTFGESEGAGGGGEPSQAEFDMAVDPDADPLPPRARSSVGVRPSDRPIERIVTLFVAARAGEELRGSDIVVAAEKAGLEFGDMGIFHRLVIGKKVDGPVF